MDSDIKIRVVANHELVIVFWDLKDNQKMIKSYCFRGARLTIQSLLKRKPDTKDTEENKFEWFESGSLSLIGIMHKCAERQRILNGS